MALPAKSSLRFVSLGLFVWLEVASRCGASDPPPRFTPVSLANASTKALQVVGSDLYVAAWGNGVQILDLSDPARPRWKGSWNPQQCPVGIQVVGHFAYVANRRAGLSVLDVRDSASPVLVGRVDISGDAMAVHVAGGYAYVANYPKGFSVVDVQNPTKPVLGTTVPLLQGASSIQVVGDYAYITEPNALHIFSVRDPRNPEPIGERRVFGPAPRIQALGKTLYLATGQSSLLTLDLAQPARPALQDRLMMETHRLPVVIKESTNRFSYAGTAWMLTNAGWRAEMEKRHGTSFPRDLSAVVAAIRESPHYYLHARIRSGISRSLHGLHVFGTTALVLAPNALELVEVADPTNPWLVGHVKLATPTWDVRAANGFGYVMDTGANIHVVDLREPKVPVQVAQFSARNYASPILAVNEADLPAPAAATPDQDVPVVADAPELSDPQRLPDGALAFNLKGVAGARYIVQASENLATWTAISTNRLPAIGLTRITDPAAAMLSHRFYRAVME